MGDSPLAALRMSPVSLAAVVQREVGVDCIVHVACRDRNLIALQGDRIIDTFYISLDSGEPFAADKWVINNERWSVTGEGDLPDDPQPAHSPEPSTLALFSLAGTVLLLRRR